MWRSEGLRERKRETEKEVSAGASYSGPLDLNSFLGLDGQD